MRRLMMLLAVVISSGCVDDGGGDWPVPMVVETTQNCRTWLWDDATDDVESVEPHVGCPDGYDVVCPGRPRYTPGDPGDANDALYEPYCTMRDGRAICAVLEGGRIVQEGPRPVCVLRHVDAS
jgi:hypothetical protein